MNAVVFLGVKEKGRAVGHFKPLEQDKFGRMVEFCLEKDIRFGFDSCNAPRFEKFVEKFDEEKKKMFLEMSESCESGLFSVYVNCKGICFPCSFCEGEGEWKEGINILECEDFLKDIWYNKKIMNWRVKLLIKGCDENGCRSCPIFDM